MIVSKMNGSIDKPIPELRGKLGSVKYPAFGEIKYDGEFTFIFYDNDGKNRKIASINKYNKIRTQYPALTSIKIAMHEDVKSAVMLAELFFADGKRNRLYDLNSNKESDDLNLMIFDLIELDEKDITQEPLIDRKEALHDILSVSACIMSKGMKVVNDNKEAMDFFKWTVDEGYEGCVIKSMDSRLIAGPCSWVKMKMKDQSDYAVSLIDPNQERIEVQVPSVGVNSHHLVTVGVKAATRYKRYIKIGDKVTIEHQGILDSGSLRHPVLIPKKEWL